MWFLSKRMRMLLWNPRFKNILLYIQYFIGRPLAASRYYVYLMKYAYIDEVCV